MKLAVRSPFGLALDHFYDDFFDGSLKSFGSGGCGPHLDIHENEKNYQLEVDLPGIKEEDLTIEFKEGYLTISGKRDEGHEEKDKNYHRKERVWGSFKRSIYLGNKVNDSEISAVLKEGVLSLTIPKSKESVSKLIKINKS